MGIVRPPVHTVALIQAFGVAAMLVSQDKRGNRYALPNATILLNQPHGTRMNILIIQYRNKSRN